MKSHSDCVLYDGEMLGPEVWAWFAVHTLTRYEKRAGNELQEKGVETFVPLLSVKHKWSDRQRLVHEPLFPGYVFVRILPKQSTRVAVLQTLGVTGFVGARGIGTPIPDVEIQTIQTVFERNAPFQLLPYVNIGQRLRIRGGFLDGIEGTLIAINGEQSLVVSVQLIQRSIALRLEGFQIEPVRSVAPATEHGKTFVREQSVMYRSGRDNSVPTTGKLHAR